MRIIDTIAWSDLKDWSLSGGAWNLPPPLDLPRFYMGRRSMDSHPTTNGSCRVTPTMTNDLDPVDSKAVAVAAQKGGQGKSAVAMNLAHELSERGRDVVLVDLDKNGHLTSELGYREWANDSEKHIATYLSETDPPVTLNEFTLPTGYGWDFIANIPKEDHDELVDNLWHSAKEEEDTQPENFLDPFYEALKRRYDYIVVDTAPTKTKLIKATFESLNYCMIPIRIQDGGEVLKNTIQDLVYYTPETGGDPRPRISVLAIFPTFVSASLKNNTDERQLIEKLCQDQVTQGAVPNFAYIPPSVMQEIKAGTIDSIPRPGIRQAKAINEPDPLREVDPTHEQLRCFEELAAIVERGEVNRSAQPLIDDTNTTTTQGTSNSNDSQHTTHRHQQPSNATQQGSNTQQ